MLRSSIATPCPVSAPLDSILSDNFDSTTTTFDYTTEFRASLRNTKPRRRQRQATQITIHEDKDENQVAHSAARSILSRPPRRVKATQSTEGGHVDYAVCRKTGDLESTTSSEHLPRVQASRLGQAPRRSVARLSALPESPVKAVNSHIKLPPSQPSRPPRRATIFIPNDDTTMPSMYMGIFSPIKSFDPQALEVEEKEPNIEFTGIAAQMAARRSVRKSTIGIAPRRVPLQSRTCLTQESAFIEDRYGQGGGKENVPPGAQEKCKVDLVPLQKSTRAVSRRASVIGQPLHNSDRLNLYTSTASSTTQQGSSRTSELRGSVAKPAWNGGSGSRQSRPASVLRKSLKPPPPAPAVLDTSDIQPRVPTRFVIPTINPGLLPNSHDVLSDDISNPALYEDDWLHHQEVAITQLVNGLFSASQLPRNDERHSLRSQLVRVYNTSALSTMHKRLQAALFYGALSIPQDILENGARLQNDIGLKKSFVNLWLANYNLVALEAALEVVVGRQFLTPGLRTSETGSSSSRASRSRLQTFIEAYLIRNEDAKPDRDAKNRVQWSYQRTLLRSLMLVKALDLVKTERSIHMSASLFQGSASFKTSVSLVQALIQMLNPAAGDPIRSLSHIDYDVSHVQSPLEEFDYEIHNLAVDLRDGVRLTRVVELLLYPSASEALEKHGDVDNTTTLLMPEGDSVEFAAGQDWPLSQHLRTTCQSRAVRLWNVEVALAAVRNVKDTANLIEGITADDIVNGFREKTIRLLWALVGKWGLIGLVDWNDLRWETRRLRNLGAGHPLTNELYDNEAGKNPHSFETCRNLLREWARAVASSRGVTVQNFTTSFADGKAFEAIVDEYEPLVQRDDSPATKKATLQGRLTRLGCSTQFSQLFAVTEKNHIFDRDFVLAALTFLCSRLLAPTKHTRAAIVIQKAWRRHWSKVEDARKQEKRKIASACAQIIQTKQRHSRGISEDIRMADDLTAAAVSIKQTIETRNLGNESPWSMSPSPTPGEEDIWLTL